MLPEVTRVSLIEIIPLIPVPLFAQPKDYIAVSLSAKVTDRTTPLGSAVAPWPSVDSRMALEGGGGQAPSRFLGVASAGSHQIV